MIALKQINLCIIRSRDANSSCIGIIGFIVLIIVLIIMWIMTRMRENPVQKEELLTPCVPNSNNYY
jgi:hypothetical protein